MKRVLPILIFSALASCATTHPSDEDRLAMYRAHAGDPVNDFQYFGRLDGWTPLGDRALTVWTRPDQAYLLELMGTCNDLDFAPAISISSQLSQVSARFDSVHVLGSHGGIAHIPCRIKEIRPLDVKGLKEAQKELRKADAVERKAAESQ